MSLSLFDVEEKYQLKTYKKFPFSIEKGEGVWVTTTEGRKMLDLYGGHAVVCTGHCHPHVVKAVQKQAETLMFYSNLVYNPTRARAAEALGKVAPEGMKNAFFINSGAEANDNAIKVARRFTGRKTIVTFEGGFHGRTIGTLSATGIEKYRTAFSPMIPDHTFATMNDLESVAALMNDNVAAVMLEPIQSMAGIVTATPEFLRGLRELCDQHGALLMYDEIQTGFGRTGSMFYAGLHGVMPDMLTLAKSIASGIPMAAILMSDAVAETVGYGDLGTTFGAGPIASAAMLATLEVIANEELLTNVNSQRAYLDEQLGTLSIVEETLGSGFLMGIRFKVPASDIQKALLEHDIITGTSGDSHVLRILAPLVLKREEIDLFLNALRQVEESLA